MQSVRERIAAYVPCHNARATIRAAILSILNQSVPVGEIFVIDDGSTDGSGDLVGVPVIRLDATVGRGATRAKAMTHAKSELVLGCDATMTLDKMFLEHALPWFRSDRVAAVFGRIHGGAALSVSSRWRERHLFRSLLPLEVRHYSSLATGCCVVRKSAVEEVGGFNATLRAGEDADLGQRLLGAGYDVVFDPKLFATTVAKNSLMGVLERYARWNSLERMTLRNYLRQVSYAVKVMVPMDLKVKDPLGAVISILTPHYQFWWSNTRKTNEASEVSREESHRR
jgi:cellulose synthase/poly-beta-1,6-N-acetylglucosamine synthase-like glycosyltransferase